MQKIRATEVNKKMKLTIWHVYHPLEFVKDSFEKIAPINYSQKWERQS